MLEIAVHTFNSHGVQEMRNKLVKKRACKRRVDVVQNCQLLKQNLTEFIGQANVRTELADRSDVCRHCTQLRKMNCNTAGRKQGRHYETSNEVTCVLIDVGWKKESRSLSSSRAPPQLPSLARELARTPSQSRTRSKTCRRKLSQKPVIHKNASRRLCHDQAGRVLRFSTRQRESLPEGDAMWQSSYSSASCRSVAPFSTWLHGSDARNEQDLGTNKWQRDKVHKTVRLNETNTPNERVAGAVEVRRQEQLGNEQLGGAQDLP